MGIEFEAHCFGRLEIINILVTEKYLMVYYFKLGYHGSVRFYMKSYDFYVAKWLDKLNIERLKDYMLRGKSQRGTG